MVERSFIEAGGEEAETAAVEYLLDEVRDLGPCTITYKLVELYEIVQGEENG
jgi:hypothetical protein